MSRPPPRRRAPPRGWRAWCRRAPGSRLCRAAGASRTWTSSLLLGGARVVERDRGGSDGRLGGVETEALERRVAELALDQLAPRPLGRLLVVERGEANAATVRPAHEEGGSGASSLRRGRAARGGEAPEVVERLLGSRQRRTKKAPVETSRNAGAPHRRCGSARWRGGFLLTSSSPGSHSVPGVTTRVTSRRTSPSPPDRSRAASRRRSGRSCWAGRSSCSPGGSGPWGGSSRRSQRRSPGPCSPACCCRCAWRRCGPSRRCRCSPCRWWSCGWLSSA